MKIKITTILVLLSILAPVNHVYSSEIPQVSIIVMTNLGTSSSSNKISLSGDGNLILAGTENSADSNVSLIKIPSSFTSNPEIIWKIDIDNPDLVKMTSNGSRMIYINDETELICLSNQSITPIWEIVIGDEEITNAKISPNGHYVIYSTYEVSTGYIIKCVSGEDKTEIWSYGSSSQVSGFDISNNGMAIISLYNGTIIYCDNLGYAWNADLYDNIRNPSLNDAGNRILVCNHTGEDTMYYYDENLNPIITYQDEGDIAYQGFAQARSSTEILAINYDTPTHSNYMVYGFSTSSSTPLWSINTGNSRQRYGEISANGRSAIISDDAWNVRLVDMIEGKILSTFNMGSMIVEIEISEDGSIGAVLDWEGDLIVFSITFPEESSTNDDNDDIDNNANNSTEGSDGVLTNFINGFTNFDNIYSLGSTLFIGFIIGAIIFGKKKKLK